MVYQITAFHQGSKKEQYDGIESNNSLEAIDRIIKDYYSHLMLEYDNQLVVIGYEFRARRLGMVLS